MLVMESGAGGMVDTDTIKASTAGPDTTEAGRDFIRDIVQADLDAGRAQGVASRV
jgi:hypothetical protein